MSTATTPTHHNNKERHMTNHRPFTEFETAEIRCALAGLRMSAMDLIAELGERADGQPYVRPGGVKE